MSFFLIIASNWYFEIAPEVFEYSVMPAAKRAAPKQEAAGTRRRSGRLSSTQVKSAYFEGSSEDEEEKKVVSGRKKRVTQPKKRARQAESESEEEQYKEESEEEAEVQPKKRSRGRPAKKAKEESDEDQYNDVPGDEDDKDDEDDEDEDDDGPRKVTIIPLEKMRDTGGVEYEDHKVHKNTMLFLRDLKANNKRPWLKGECFEYFSVPASSFTSTDADYHSTRWRVQKSVEGLAVVCRSDNTDTY